MRGAGCFVRAVGVDVLTAALADAGVASSSAGPDALHVEAEAEQVGLIAFAAGVPVTELRPADGAGLEQMFLDLTSDTQREGVAA